MVHLIHKKAESSTELSEQAEAAKTHMVLWDMVFQTPQLIHYQLCMGYFMGNFEPNPENLLYFLNGHSSCVTFLVALLTLPCCIEMCISVVTACSHALLVVTCVL